MESRGSTDGSPLPAPPLSPRPTCSPNNTTHVMQYFSSGPILQCVSLQYTERNMFCSGQTLETIQYAVPHPACPTLQCKTKQHMQCNAMQYVLFWPNTENNGKCTLLHRDIQYIPIHKNRVCVVVHVQLHVQACYQQHCS